MNSTKELLNGGLYTLVRHLAMISEIKRCQFLSVQDLEMRPIAKLILAARTDGCHWLWAEDSIYQLGPEDGLDEPEDFFRLPSVDLHGTFNFEEHDSLRLHLKKAHKTELKGVIWDTEYSAWYPKFDTRENAVQCIETFDRLLDNKYLLQLREVVESWV